MNTWYIFFLHSLSFEFISDQANQANTIEKCSSYIYTELIEVKKLWSDMLVSVTFTLAQLNAEVRFFVVWCHPSHEDLWTSLL